MKQGLHFVFSNFAPSGYNRGVLAKAKTKLIMMMDLRGGPIRCGVRAEGSRTFRSQPERRSCRWGARSSRPLPSASRRRAGGDRAGAAFGEWNLPPHLFGETPNRTTGTVALPSSDCIVSAKKVSAIRAGRPSRKGGVAG